LILPANPLFNEGKTGTRILFAAAIAVFLVHAWVMNDAFYGNAYDDAYISFRYADNLVEGHGLVFNRGERVEGFTNLLWVLATALALQTGSDPVKSSQLLGVICAILAMWAAIMLPRQRATSRHFGATWPLLPLVFGASFTSAAISGMETAAWLAAIMFALLFFSRAMEDAQNNVKTALACSVFLALTILLRADGFVFLVYLTLIGSVFFRKKFLNRNFLVPFLLPATITLIILFGWRYYYFGQLLPNTYYAKVDIGLGGRLTNGFYYLLRFGFVYALYFMLLIIGMRKNLSTAVKQIYLPLAGLQALYLIIVGGDFPYLYRFALPILILLYVALAEGFSAGAQTEKTSGSIRNLAFNFVFVMLTAGASFFFAEDFLVHRAGADLDNDRVLLGQWLGRNAPPDAVVAVKAAGQIPYFSRLETVDYYGLTDPQVKSWPVGDGVYGHKKYSLDYIMSRRPEIVAGVFVRLVGRDDFNAQYLPVAPNSNPQLQFWVRRDYFSRLPGIVAITDFAPKMLEGKSPAELFRMNY
jgi:arabinofuranosyltransferase